MKNIKIQMGVAYALEISDNRYSYYSPKCNFYIYTCDTLAEILKISFERDYTYKIVENEYYFSVGNQLQSLNLETRQLQTIYQTDLQNVSLFDKDSILTSSYIRESRSVESVLIDRKTQNERWCYKGNLGIRLHDNHSIFRTSLKGDIIALFDNISGEKHWQLELNMNKIYGQIFKFSNILTIPLKNNHLIGLSATTGEKLWELEDCFYDYNLDESTGLLYAYGGDTYEIIDVQKGEKMLHKRFEGSKERYAISADQNMCSLSGDGLYFTSNWCGSTKFGKVNIHTHEIEFVQELDVEEGVKASKPTYHQGRLYILDSAHTLHIFEEDK